jgi:hypothetical protein
MAVGLTRACRAHRRPFACDRTIAASRAVSRDKGPRRFHLLASMPVPESATRMRAAEQNGRVCYGHQDLPRRSRSRCHAIVDSDLVRRSLRRQPAAGRLTSVWPASVRPEGVASTLPRGASTPLAYGRFDGQAVPSHYSSTLSARRVFQRLGVPTPPSRSKWTRPVWMRSSSHRPSGCRFDRTTATASAIRGSGRAPECRK